MAELNTYCTETEDYIDREPSWLEFNYRVLNEARGRNLPLFERLKFLGTTTSNLDEFFVVRVASLEDMVHAGCTKLDLAGLCASGQLVKIREETHEFANVQYSTYNHSLVPMLGQNGLRIVEHHEELTGAETGCVGEYLEEDTYPVLIPVAMDSSRPLPLIYNKSLNITALLQERDGGGDLDFTTMQVPKGLPRVVETPSSGKERVAILLGGIIERNIHSLFLNYNIISTHPYRVMGNADLTIDEGEAKDLLVKTQEQLKKRRWDEAIRLGIEEKTDKRLLKQLKKELELDSDNTYEIGGPLNLTFLTKMYGFSRFKELKTPKYMPQQNPTFMNDNDTFANIRKGDVLLHHPYESFQPVVEFIQEAAKNLEVLAIKQTLYCVSDNSPTVAALAEAADNGRQMSVLMEPKARFDEENNVIWVKMLGRAGCHMIYGLLGSKTHSEITLIVKREKDGIRRYVHLETGNYNSPTAELYTNCGLFTYHPQIGEGATAVPNMLSGYSELLHWNQLIVAPIWLRKRLTRMIRREAESAGAGKTARIIAKVNSLCDGDIIGTLYEASCTGVQIDLIVHGICSLKTSVPSLNENIRVHSIVDNFLEHNRIFYSESDGAPEIYMGSADQMPRNLDRRVEITLPVLDEKLKQKVFHILQIQLDDNVKAHILMPNGTYEKINKRGKALVNAQDTFCGEAMQTVKDELDRRGPVSNRVSVPIESHN